MRFLLDENVDFRLAAFLRSLGHDVAAIAYDFPNALSDSVVLAIAEHDERVLITNDRDFGELIFRRGSAHAGVIYLRLGSTALTHLEDRLRAVLARYSGQLDHFIVVTDQRVRLRESGSTPT